MDLSRISEVGSTDFNAYVANIISLTIIILRYFWFYELFILRIRIRIDAELRWRLFKITVTKPTKQCDANTYSNLHSTLKRNILLKTNHLTPSMSHPLSVNPSLDIFVQTRIGDRYPTLLQLPARSDEQKQR